MGLLIQSLRNLEAASALRVWWCARAGMGLLVWVDAVKDGDLRWDWWDPGGAASPASCQHPLVWTGFYRSSHRLFWTLPASDKEPLRGMSHGERNSPLFPASFILFCAADENVASVSVPCIGPPEPGGGRSSP